MSDVQSKAAKSGLLPVLRALGSGGSDLDLSQLPHSAVHAAIECGLGPVLAHVSRDWPDRLQWSFAREIQAADLTARLLTADILDATGRILRALDATPCRPLLIKGAATALLHYPAPHLRTMGDIDLCISPEHQSACEAKLRALGFTQSSELPAEFYEHHHHSMPFRHPDWHVWVDVHTRLFPPQSPLAGDPRFALARIERRLETRDIQGSPVRVMTDELQLMYASARWLEELDVDRGIFPMLDVAMMIRSRGGTLDWDRILATWAESPSLASTAVHVVLGYLCRRGIISVPRQVLTRLAAHDVHTNRASRWILDRLVTAFLLERRRYGRYLTQLNTDTVWSTLLGSSTPLHNLLKLPFHIAFPPNHPRRFDLAFTGKRLRSWRAR